MTENLVRYAFADGIAEITLAAGEKGNPISPATVTELLAAVRAAESDQARVIVLAADGRFFSVGGDIGGFSGAEDMSRFIDDLAEALHRVVSELWRSPAVVLTSVQGMAAGAGFSLAAAGDIVLAAESAKFTFSYTKIGLTPDGGATLMAHSLGLHRMLRLALLNDVVTAAEAADAGLVARVVPDAELAAVTRALAEQLAAGSAPAQAAAKRLIRTALVAGPETALRAESLSIRARAGSADGAEGVRAFGEKRPPVFGESGY